MMIELKCLTCIHGELCSYKHGGVDLAIISGDCKSYKSTADVVPKSEVEEIVRQWKEEANCWQNNYITEIRANEQIKAEVAREIFEEIDELLVQNATMQIATSTLHCKLAELKKKYTKESEGNI
jgi:ketopantoate reductase